MTREIEALSRTMTGDIRTKLVVPHAALRQAFAFFALRREEIKEQRQQLAHEDAQLAAMEALLAIAGDTEDARVKQRILAEVDKLWGLLPHEPSGEIPDKDHPERRDISRDGKDPS